MDRYKLLIALLLLGMVIAFGCTDRGTNVPTRVSVDDAAIDPNRNSPIATPALNFQVFNPEGIIQMAVYTPLKQFIGRDPMPLLVLLAPEYESKFYYADHGIVELADEMIKNGEIGPVVIAMVGNDQIFGGYFYANSFPGGAYDSVLGPAIFNQLSGFIGFPLIDSPGKRAIGGFGQGAYGAFRAAITHPGYYGSVVTGDGPLDFDGPTGSGGLTSLFTSVFAEQGKAVGDASIFSSFDSSIALTMTQYFIGGALAFSPHDTLIVFDTIRTLDTTIFGDTFVVAIDYPITSNRDTAGFIVTDSMTLVSGLIKGDATRNDFNFDFHLPFDASANTHAPIWSMWMANNLEALAANNPGALSNTNVWIGTTNEGTFGPWSTYGEQSQSWISSLQGMGVNVSSASFSGYGGNPATRDEYVFDLLREMLLYADSSTFSK